MSRQLIIHFLIKNLFFRLFLLAWACYKTIWDETRNEQFSGMYCWQAGRNEKHSSSKNQNPQKKKLFFIFVFVVYSWEGKTHDWYPLTDMSYCHRFNERTVNVFEMSTHETHNFLMNSTMITTISDMPCKHLTANIDLL